MKILRSDFVDVRHGMRHQDEVTDLERRVDRDWKSGSR